MTMALSSPCIAPIAEDLLNCSICFDSFRNPKVLPCLHTFCQDCIHRHFEIFRLSNGGRLSCPTCRELIPLPPKGVPGFRCDATIARTRDLLEDLFADFGGFGGDEGSCDIQLLGACGVDRTQVEGKNGEMRACANSLQDVLTKMRSKLLQLYLIENHVRFTMDAEKSAINCGPPGKIDREEVQKKREQIEQNHSSSLAQLATEQDRLYQSISHIKSIHDVIESLLENGDGIDLDTAFARLSSLAREALEKQSPTHVASKHGKDISDPMEEWSQLLQKNTPSETRGNDALANFQIRDLQPKLDTSKKLKTRLLFRVGGTGTAPGLFDYPVDATFLPDGSFIVCDKNNERLQVFDKSGSFLSEFLKGDVKPRRLCLSPRDGMLYLSDELAECIKVYTLDGQLVRRIGETFFQCPAGMAIDSKGNIIMTDAEKCFVSVHHPKDGKFLSRFYYRFMGDLKIPCPYYAATNEDDHLIVSDFRNNIIKVFSNTGQILFKITKLKCPRGVCTDPYGNILVAEGDGDCVSMYSPYGKYLCKVLTEEDGLKYPLALDMNASGQLLVTQCGPFTSHEVLGFQLYV